MSSMMLVCLGIIYGTVILSRYLIGKFDEVEWMVGKRERLLIFCGSAVNCVVIGQMTGSDWCRGMLLAIVAGCLLFACLTDCKTCEVYQFTWWVAGGVAGVLLYNYMLTDGGVMALESIVYQNRRLYYLVELLTYIALQELFFSRMYGRADCHAFVVCAMTGCALGMDFGEYLVHMSLAFGSLAIVQILRRNINRRGNLKRPVAFLPYIVISFWVMIYYFRY